jgi:hypothetical protein
MLRIVHGRIGSSRATSIRPIAVVPSRHSRSQPQRTAAKTTKAPAISVYSGRNIAVTPKRKPGRSQTQALPRLPSEPSSAAAPAPPPLRAAVRSQAHRKARIAAGRESIAGGSLITSPTEWMKGG